MPFTYEAQPSQVHEAVLYGDRVVQGRIEYRVVRVCRDGQPIGDLIECPKRGWWARLLGGEPTQFTLPSRIQGAQWLEQAQR